MRSPRDRSEIVFHKADRPGRHLVDVASQSLRADPWFSSLPPEMQALLRGVAMIREMPGDEVIFAVGSPPSGLHALLRGSIHVSHFDAAGRYRFYHVFKPISWVGVLSEADLRPQMQTTISGGPTTLFYIDHSAVQRILSEVPSFGWCLARLAAHQARLLGGLVADSNVLTTPNRVAKALLSISEPSSCAHASAIVSNVNQEMLAAIAGVSRQTINRLLKTWETQQLLMTEYRRITILDVHRFARLTVGITD